LTPEDRSIVLAMSQLSKSKVERPYDCFPSALAYITEGEVALGTPYESFVGLPNVDSGCVFFYGCASVCQSRRTNANFCII
jgi:hypothetical protein